MKIMTHARSLLLLFVTLLTGVAAARAAVAQPVKSDGKDDVVLSAMRDELERSKSQLRMDQVAAPYYIEYRIFDVDEYSAEASFGALRGDVRVRFRFIRVVVRIGDYKQDSYFGQGEGTPYFMPVDDDITALRHQLWIATDIAYKAAAESLAAKQAQLKQLTIDQPVDDFAHADPVQSVGPLVKLEFDPEPWKKMLQETSALYKKDPDIEAFESNLRFQAVNRYFVNSEGTVVRSGRNLYQMMIACRTQAADGMSLSRDNGFFVSSVKELPSAAEFMGRAEMLAQTLKDLRNAPLVEEEYRGPVLFSADAAAASYKTRVLPDFLSVMDDPTISMYAGNSLLGHYEIDDEGVPAQRVSLIDHGNLVNYDLGRAPIRDFPASNGHGRAAVPTNSPGPSLGNLIVTSSQPTSKEDLKKKLLEQCRQRDLPYCYYVETFGPRLTPRLLYKVWAKDGHQELVRGAIFGELDVRALRSSVIAAGNDAYVESRPTNIPHSIVAPSILFDELEVKRANLNKEKLPDYPAPAVK
jgi:hypothetical protein